MNNEEKRHSNSIHPSVYGMSMDVENWKYIAIGENECNSAAGALRAKT